MQYTFDIVGVSPILHFFNHQQENLQKPYSQRVEYLGTQICTLDAFLESIESVPSNGEWYLDRAIETVIEFWLNNAESIQYWKNRLRDAGKDNLLVGRLADIKSLQAEFESLLHKN
jgi:hypothetical protein